MGDSAFQSGTLGGIPSLPSVLDFLAAKWLQETDLNRRHTAYEAAVLPLHHPAMCPPCLLPDVNQAVNEQSRLPAHVPGSDGAPAL